MSSVANAPSSILSQSATPKTELWRVRHSFYVRNEDKIVAMARQLGAIVVAYVDPCDFGQYVALLKDGNFLYTDGTWRK